MKKLQSNKEKHLSGLNDATKAKLEELTSPSAARMAPKDAEAMGLPADSPMIQGAVPPQPSRQPPVTQTETPAQPQGAAPEAGLDINSMLGGM